MKKLQRYFWLILTVTGIVLYPTIKESFAKARQAQVRQRIADELSKAAAEDQRVLDRGEAAVANNFYYQQLTTDTERADYIRFLESFQTFSDKTETKSVDFDSLSNVYLAVAYDYPDFYWLLESDQFDFENHTYPDNVKETYNRLQAMGDEVIAHMPDGSEYDKVKYIYEYIIQNTQYNVAALEDDALAWQNQSIRSVFLDKSSVCAGYSRAFQFLCQKAGIESIYVVGNIAAYEEEHAWNLVKINGQYYPIDVTWGDPVFEAAVTNLDTSSINYAYLCTPKAIFEASHTPWQGFYSPFLQEVTYPEIAESGFNFFDLSGNYFDSYEQEKVGQRIVENLQNASTNEVSIQFGSKEAYKAALSDLENEQTYLHNHLIRMPNYQGFEFFADDYTNVISVRLLS